ncbi:MAG: hypothetical protein CL566_04545 [Alphaproteobacteria bacterium]|nr:hypothetical protein [Alphaproteobacteria bacterium]
MKKTLLASTALVGAALMAAPASAGTVGSKDALNVSLGGTLWFAVVMKDEDVSAGQGRGYRFTVNESEVHVKASNTADNGIKYGVAIELNGGGNDGTAADEAHAFISSKSWGRIELGDNDDVTNRMQLGAWNAHKGLGGPFGGLGMLVTGWGGVGSDTLQARADWQVLTTSDTTKVSYFSPRFSGFQVGASLTPDTGVNSASLGDTDNDGDEENVIGLAANYVGKFDDVSIGLSAQMENGTGESASGSAAVQEDLSVWGVGGNIGFGGFKIGAHYRDLGDTFLTTALTAAGADSGSLWAVAVGYQAGPWGVSAWYHEGTKDNSTTASAAGALETTVERLGFGAGYTVAPGWLLRADLEFLNHENATTAAGTGATTDNDGTAFLLTNMFFF